MSTDAPPPLDSPDELSDSTGPPRTPPLPKPARRATAVYPLVNASNKPLKPFSRSAAKRESVMALGSIEHLQHYFTKTGLSAPKNPLKPNSGFVPAIGGHHMKAHPSLGRVQEFELPPSPVFPPPVNRPPFPIIEKTYETNPENLKPGVIEDLHAVAVAWRIDEQADTATSAPQMEFLDPNPEKGKSRANGEFDVLRTLKITTRAIRSVRNYLMSLPDDTAIKQSHKQQFRPPSLSPMPVRRLVSQPNSPSDPLTLVRRCALEVLSVLRKLEESARLPLSEEAYDAQSDHESHTTGSNSRAASPAALYDDPDASFSFYVLPGSGHRGPIPVWPDEESESDEEEEPKREPWDDRLVVGSGWLYRDDIRLEDLSEEQKVIEKYLNSVDEVLFGGPHAGKRGWERALSEKPKPRRQSSGGSDSDGLRTPDMGSRRVVSTGSIEALQDLTIMEEAEPVFLESVDDDDLPNWAKRSTFSDDPLGRAQALLVELLPASMLNFLPGPAADRVSFLSALSSGQILCFAYNTGVRRSRKPWGYINPESIHDIVALELEIGKNDTGEEARRVGWTFRRTDNLRLWAAALKLRYQIPVVTPNVETSNGNTGTPSKKPMLGSPRRPQIHFPMADPSVIFDAKAVARKDDSWDVTLETVLHCWVDAVVGEMRGDR